jgi:6-phosphogluconolactonase
MTEDRVTEDQVTEDRVRFLQYDSAADVAAAAAGLILSAAVHAIHEHGRFNLVLAGGRTPIAAYTRLVGAAADWGRWHCFFGDERCLSRDDPERNSLAAARAFFDRVPIPASHLYPIAAEQGPVAAATAYQATLAAHLPFDLVLLGMGEDGHTASLFPGQGVPDGPLVIPVTQAPKPPPERVSMTPKALAATHGMLILVTGRDKASALAAWRAGHDLPVARVASLGSALVLVDRDAASGDECPRSD